MKKKLGLTILLVVFCVFIFAACADNQQPEAGADPAPAPEQQQEQQEQEQEQQETQQEEEAALPEDVSDLAGTVIRFATSAPVSEAHAIEVERLIAEFYDLTGIIVELEMVYDAYRTWLSVQHTANNAPDIMDLNFNWAWEDYQRGFLVDLTPYLNSPNPFNNNMILGDTLSPLLAMQAVIPGTDVVPIVASRVAGVKIAYNRDLFAQAGITEPPFTFDEFMAAGDALREIGVTPIAFSNTPVSANMNWMLHNFVSQMDADLRLQMDLNQNNLVALNELAAATYNDLIDFSQPPFTDAFGFLREISQHFNSDFNSVDVSEVLDMFLGGRAAMVLLGSFNAAVLDEVELGFEYGLLMFPALTTDNHPNASGRPLNNGGRLVDGYALNAHSTPEARAAAVQFMMYMLSPEPLVTFMEVLSTLPPLNEASIELGGAAVGWLTSEREDILRAIYFGNATSVDFTEFQVMSSQIFLVDPSMTPEQYGAELNVRWREVMEAAMLEHNWGPENNWGEDEDD